MTDPPNGNSRVNVESIKTTITFSLTVAKLKHLLRHSGLTQTGNKPVLVDRLLVFIRRCERDRNDSVLHEIASEIRKLQSDSSPVLAPVLDRRQSYTQMVNSLTTEFTLGRMSPGLNMGPTVPYTSPFVPRQPGERIPAITPRASTLDNLPLTPSTLDFEPHVFYMMKTMLSRPVVLAGPYSRETYTRSLSFKLPPNSYELLSQPENMLQVGLVAQRYCAPLVPQPIQFPPNISIRIGDHFVSASTRGVKNHPGSTPPVNLTSYVLKDHRGNYRVEVTVHINLRDPRKDDNMSSKAFAFGIALIQQRSEAELIQQLKDKPHIPAEATKEQIRSIHEPEDANDVLMATDSVHSLKDPVMYTRITLPIRSRRCTHIDCFDASVYIQLQFQATTWKCPICNKVITWDSLEIDDYFVEILETADDDVDQVNVLADGSWTVRSRALPDSDSDSDDEMPQKRSRSEQIEIIDLVSDDDEPAAAAPIPPAARTQEPNRAAVSQAGSIQLETADRNRQAHSGASVSVGSSATATSSSAPEPVARTGEALNAQSHVPSDSEDSNDEVLRLGLAQIAARYKANLTMPDAAQNTSTISNDSSASGQQTPLPSMASLDVAAARLDCNWSKSLPPESDELDSLFRNPDDDTDEEVPSKASTPTIRLRLPPPNDNQPIAVAASPSAENMASRPESRAELPESMAKQSNGYSALPAPPNPPLLASDLLNQIKHSRDSGPSGAPLRGFFPPTSPTPLKEPTENASKLVPQPHPVSMLFSGPGRPEVTSSSVDDAALGDDDTEASPDDYFATKQRLDQMFLSRMNRRPSRSIEIIDLIDDD